MKTKFFTLFLLSITFMVSAQNIEETKVSFKDTILPLTPLGKSLKGYHFTVRTPYPESGEAFRQEARWKYEEYSANYPAIVAESKVKHQEALVQYEQDVEVARENFKIESEEFNNLKMVERMAMADKKPVLRLPRKPVYVKPAEPEYVEPYLGNMIIVNPKALVSKHLSLAGFEEMEAGEDVLVGNIVFYDFEYMEPERHSRKVEYYDKETKEKKEKTEYYYLTSYKRQIELTLTFNGQSLYGGTFEGTGDFIEIETKSIPNKRNLERASIDENLPKINDFINNQYGFSKIGTELTVRYVKNKKGAYDDLEDAKDYAVAGYGSYSIESKELQDVSSMWNEALEESDLDDKKARINKKVTKVLLFNLIEVAIYTNQFDRAKEYVAQLEKIKLKYLEKEELKATKAVLEDKITRMEANSTEG